MIYLSGIISLCIQLLVGVIDYLALKVKLKPEDELLKDLLQVELYVQVVEFLFYICLIYFFHQVSNVTPYRYLDWAITTPLMLITLSAFLNHEGKSTSPRLRNFLFTHSAAVMKIISLNAAMLFFGFIGEMGYLNVYLSTALGFLPFLLNFKYIKDTFLPSRPGGEDKYKNRLFNWFVFFWGLYGVCAVMSYTYKNTGYNILDIFSKNFFGLFLAYTVWQKVKEL